MKSPQHQPQRIDSPFQQPAFWIAVVVYILLTVGVWSFVSSPLFRTFVEHNSNGYFSGYFSKYAGYDVVGSVVEDVRGNIFLVQQVVAVLVSLVLIVLRKQIAVALGILAVILTFLVIAFCAALLWVVFRRHGY